MIKKIFIFLVLIIILPNYIYATDSIISSQLDALNLSSFISEGKKYTEDVFENMDIDELLTSAISGKIDKSTLYEVTLKILGEEIASAIMLLGSILIIIVIHSILKSIGENIGNNSISQIAYYAQYILIVTLIMSNFSEIISSIKETITNLVGFVNTLIPILLALIVTTGNTISANLLQPVILFSVVFISNSITLIIIPILLIATVLGIVSNISDKIQIDKLSKFLKSSIVWVLGFVITIFVSILSLEGNLTSSVDALTIKGLKAASSTFIPVVGKALGDSVDTVLRSYISYKKWNRNCRNNNYYRNLYIANYKINSINSII